MDRLATRVNLLMRSESYQYDLAGETDGRLSAENGV